MSRTIDLIVVHCAATRPSLDIGAKEIRQWHLDRGWQDIGYHFVIRRNGQVEDGRDIAKAGAHAAGHNQNSIGICLVGGINESGQPADQYTTYQHRALHDLLLQLRDRFPHTRICGHRDLPGVSKACPSFDVSDWLRLRGIGPEGA